MGAFSAFLRKWVGATGSARTQPTTTSAMLLKL
jgi:hypothetical protein